MWTVYTMWNGQNVTLMLQAVAATFSDTSYAGLLRTVSLLAFFAVIIGVAARGRMDGLWQWFIGFMILVTLGVTVKTNVNVVDYRFNYAQQVQDVPFVLAIGYGEISHFGYWMTQKYETNFTPPNSATFEQYGMVFGAQVAATMASLKASDPIVNDNIISITQTCLAPEFIQNPLSIATVVKSTDLANDVPQILNPGRLADVTDANGNTDVMPCDKAWATAMQQYDASSASLYNYAVAKMLPGQTTIGRLQNNPSVVTALASNIPTVADQLLINSSQTTAGMIKQAALANAIRTAGSKLQTSVAAINEQLAGAMATSASDNTYAVMSTLAANVLPALHNVIELIVIGLFPLVMVMAFVAGPMILGVIRMWLTAAGWIQFWGPLYALVNGIMSSQSNIRVHRIAHKPTRSARRALRPETSTVWTSIATAGRGSAPTSASRTTRRRIAPTTRITRCANSSARRRSLTQPLRTAHRRRGSTLTSARFRQHRQTTLRCAVTSSRTRISGWLWR